MMLTRVIRVRCVMHLALERMNWTKMVEALWAKIPRKKLLYLASGNSILGNQELATSPD